MSVMLRRVPDEVPAIRRSWSEMERALRSLRGRKFYGSFDPMTNEYAVCVVIRQGDDPRALGLEQATLPGGRYVRARLKGEPPAVYDLIPPTMQPLADRPDPILGPSSSSTGGATKSICWFRSCPRPDHRSSGDINEPRRTTVSCSSTSSPSSAATRSKVCVSRSRTGGWSSRGWWVALQAPRRAVGGGHRDPAVAHELRPRRPRGVHGLAMPHGLPHELG